MKNERIPQSIIGEELTTNEVKAVLDTQRSLYKIEKQIHKEGDQTVKDELKELQKVLIDSLDEEIGEYQRMVKVNELYTKKYGEM